MTLPAVLLAAIFCLGLAPPATAAEQPLTLGEAMLLALKHNPGSRPRG